MSAHHNLAGSRTIASDNSSYVRRAVRASANSTTDKHRATMRGTRMDFGQRHIGSITSEVEGSGGVAVDPGELLLRLILFEHTVIESNRLKELTALVEVFGASGLIELIDAGALEIICDAMTIGEVGQVAILESTIRRGGPLPFGAYHFSGISSADVPDYRHRVLRELDSSSLDRAGLTVREQQRLKKPWPTVSLVIPEKLAKSPSRLPVRTFSHTIPS